MSDHLGDTMTTTTMLLPTVSSPACIMMFAPAILVFLSAIKLVDAVSLKQAVVVGAGPAGMSTALVLARRHGCNVTGK